MNYHARIAAIVLAILCAIINVDLILVSSARHYPIIPVFLICVLIGNLKLYYSYVCMGWFGSDIAKLNQRFNKKWITKCLFFFGYREPDAARMHAWSKKGKLGIFLLGALPQPGIRSLGLALCRVQNDEWALFVLAWGNCVRFAYIAWCTYGILQVMSH